MQVDQVNVRDDDAFKVWYAASSAAVLVGRPDAGPFVASASDTRAELLHGDAEAEFGLYGVYESRELVGTSLLTLPRRENTSTVFAKVMVAERARRRGVGTALLEHAVELTLARGRSAVVGQVSGPAGETLPGEEFARARGFETAMATTHRRLDLPLDERRRAPLQQSVQESSAEYRVEVWRDVPDDCVDAYCALLEAMSTDTPMGDLDSEPEVWDRQRLREVTARRKAQGRSGLTAVAYAPGGDLVGNSELVIKPDSAGHVSQANTLVLRAHRGHRLGLALKLANLDALSAEFPLAVAVHTATEDTNTPIIAVNEQLGFLPVEREIHLRHRL